MSYRDRGSNKALDEPADSPLKVRAWRRREIENYLCHRDTLLAYACDGLPDDLLGRPERERRVRLMELARLLPKAAIDPEIGDALDLIAQVAQRARPQQ